MKKATILRWKDGKVETVADRIAEECFIHVEIEDKAAFDTIVTPEKIKEFVFGNLFAEGIIDSPSDVKEYSVREKSENLFAKVRLSSSKSSVLFHRNYNILWTDCGGLSHIQKRMGNNLRKIKTTMLLKAKDIPRVLIEAGKKSDLYRKTGAYHYAFFFDSSIFLGEWAHDVSRHNAVDKAIGMRFLKGSDFDEHFLFTTGRITSDMILKCLRTRMPMLVSRGAPLHEAVRLAKEYNLGLIGFLRGKRFNVYSGESMIDFGASL